jgi:hypothetical protein
MPQQHPSEETKAAASYRLIRSGVRAWLALSRRSVRVLGTQRLPESGAILYVCHPADFEDALVLVAAFERPVVCVIDRVQMAGRQSLLESGLGMIPSPTEAPREGPAEASARLAALRSCAETLAGGGLALVFSEAGEAAGRKPTALRLACEAWAGAFPEHAPVILPVHRFRPETRAQEILIHVGDPVRLDSDDDPGLLQQHARAALGEVANVFALDAALLTRLMREVERNLLDRLQQNWAAQPGRKRKANGFRLSPRTVETLRRLNWNDPQALVALSELLEAEHEARREWSLAQLRGEIEIRQLSGLQRLLGWAESVVGLPVACYGALNHLSTAFLLFVCGLLKRDAQPHLGPWLARAVILLGCYAGQVALVNHFLGRAAAGYYAVTLPVSGAYLARYWWLIQRRTRVLLAGTRSAMLQTLANRNLARFFEKLDAILAGETDGTRAASGA